MSGKDFRKVANYAAMAAGVILAPATGGLSLAATYQGQKNLKKMDAHDAQRKAESEAADAQRQAEAEAARVASQKSAEEAQYARSRVRRTAYRANGRQSTIKAGMLSDQYSGQQKTLLGS